MHDNKLTDEEKRDRLKNKQKKIKLSSKLHHNECARCNKIFIAKQKNNSYCSVTCYYQYSLEVGINECVVCSNMFKTKKPKEKCCSDECRVKHRKSRRAKNIRNSKRKKKDNGTYEKDSHRSRAKRLNAKYERGVTLSNIIKRDGNKCLICGKKVLDNNVSGYHKDNGTIGHIIAMCNGGEHTMRNVQLECMECNVKKGSNDS